jgi:hypothetical protein
LHAKQAEAAGGGEAAERLRGAPAGVLRDVAGLACTLHGVVAGAATAADVEAVAALVERAQVRKTPRWPRRWANSSLSQLHSHRNGRANLHLSG